MLWFVLLIGSGAPAWGQAPHRIVEGEVASVEYGFLDAAETQLATILDIRPTQGASVTFAMPGGKRPDGGWSIGFGFPVGQVAENDVLLLMLSPRETERGRIYQLSSLHGFYKRVKGAGGKWMAATNEGDIVVAFHCNGPARVARDVLPDGVVGDGFFEPPGFHYEFPEVAQVALAWDDLRREMQNCPLSSE